MIVAVSQRVDLWPQRGERRDALDQRLAQWLYAAGCVPLPVPNGLPDGAAVAAWLRAVKAEAIVLSGGNDIGDALERDATERAMLDFASKYQLPLLGICRGMQMMAVWAGTALKTVNAHVGCRHQLRGEIVAEVNSYHNLALANCPSGFSASAYSEDGAIEAISHQHLPWQGWMWHPERESYFAAHDTLRLQMLFGLPSLNYPSE